MHTFGAEKIPLDKFLGPRAPGSPKTSGEVGGGGGGEAGSGGGEAVGGGRKAVGRRGWILSLTFSLDRATGTVILSMRGTIQAMRMCPVMVLSWTKKESLRLLM